MSPLAASPGATPNDFLGERGERGERDILADVLSISENVARKHYAKWSSAHQERISGIMRRVFTGTSEETQRVAAVQ